MKQVLVEVVQVVLYWLMIAENSMEKNSDERETMLDYYSKQQLKNKQIDQVMVEIVEKMHDEENQHQALITLVFVMQPNQTINK
jgi:hypothetical protein